MKLSEALGIINRSRTIGSVQSYNLICGFTPLHLETYIKAMLQMQDYEHRVVINLGVYGDIFSGLNQSARTVPTIICLEWGDFDPRLSWRSLGFWSNEILENILSTFKGRLDRFAIDLEKAAEESRIIVTLPLLPLPPIGTNPYIQTHPHTLLLKGMMLEFGARLSLHNNVRILNDDAIRLENSDLDWDFKSYLKNGYPYTLGTTARLATKISRLVVERSPIKGIITDLDNTCWSGIIGDDGLDGIGWTQEHGAHEHGLYQAMLTSLAQAGTLVAIASKNSEDTVAEALELTSIMLNKAQIFPIEVNWGRKSDSVSRILNAWNISAGDVLFVDDNPLELAEVKQAFPEMECVRFPVGEPNKVKSLIVELRDRCGKSIVSPEDLIRLDSIRKMAVYNKDTKNLTSSVDFISTLDASITYSISDRFIDDRALELVNKTNQFNLNGKRFTLQKWVSLKEQADRFLLSFEYNDKFGALGRISVLSGVIVQGQLVVDVWVMSCRAFSRDIEYFILSELFAHFEVDEICFEFLDTIKNAPLKTFLLTHTIPEPIGDRIVIAADDFVLNCPDLHHTSTKKLN